MKSGTNMFQNEGYTNYFKTCPKYMCNISLTTLYRRGTTLYPLAPKDYLTSRAWPLLGILESLNILTE